MKRSCSLVLAAFACVLLVGCGGNSGMRVQGTLVKDGQPLVPKKDEEVSMSFIALAPNAPVGLGSVNFDAANGTFTVHGPTQQGLPPGEYKITVLWSPYQQPQRDYLRGEFSAEKTPLRYTVTSEGAQEIEVDVSQKKVTRK